MKEWRKQYKGLIEAPLEEQNGPKCKEELDEMKMPYEDYCKAIFAPGHEMGKPEALKGIRWMSLAVESGVIVSGRRLNDIVIRFKGL